MQESSAVHVFQFRQEQVRAIYRHNEAWFVAKDVCDVLALTNPSESVKNLEPEEVADISITDTSSSGVSQKRNVIIVSESGLYALIFKSRKEEARAFRVWVTREVLPAIRKTGTYAKKTVALDVPLGPSKYPFFNRPDCAAILSELNKAAREGLLNAEGFSRIVFESTGRPWKNSLPHPTLDNFISSNLSLVIGGYETTRAVHDRYLSCTGDELTRNKFTHYLVTRHPTVSVKQKKLDGRPVQIYLNVKLTPEPVKIESAPETTPCAAQAGE